MPDDETCRVLRVVSASLSPSLAQEEGRVAGELLRALAGQDGQVLRLAMAHCRRLLRDAPDEPAVRNAVRVLAYAMQLVEHAPSTPEVE